MAKKLKLLRGGIMGAVDSLAYIAVKLGVGAIRLLGSDTASAAGAAVTRSLGPLLPVHRVALDNLRHAFPDLPDSEHRRIAREAWDNLGRTACEYVHMDRIWDFDPENPDNPKARIRASRETIARYVALAEDGKPALIFAAHLANWELPAVAAAKHGLASAVLYRTPNNPIIARDIERLRTSLMGRLIAAGPMAPLRLLEAADEGLHVGMLIDQRFGRGPRVPFFGRPASSNPLLARIARRIDCPVHGARAIRTQDGRGFRLELTEAIDLPRGADGRVDVEAATALLNRIVEGWIREHPGQWLWQHRRWRD